MKINDKQLQERIDWEPFFEQENVIEDFKRKRDLRIVAGRRGGKTAVAAYLALRTILKDDKRIWIVAPCVDPKTKALTKDGWKSHIELKEGDELLTLNDKGEAEWQECQNVTTYDYKGELIHFKQRGHDSLTTPHHRWLVGYTGRDTQNGGRKTLGYRFTKTEDFGKSNEFILGSAEVNNIPQEKKRKDAFVELVGWYWTEGSDNGSGIRITQNEGDNVDRIREAALELFGEPDDKNNYQPLDEPRWTDWKQRGESGDFYFNKIIADKIKSAAPNKVIKPEFINSLTKEQLDLLLDVSVAADGHERTRETKNKKHRERIIVQKDKERLDSIQMVAQLAGYQTNLRKRKDGKHILQIFERNKIWPGQREQKKNQERVDYEGIVWCPTTPNGTWLARRNGTVYFTGNTYELTKKVFNYVTKWLKQGFPETPWDIKTRPFPKIDTKWDSWLEGKSTTKTEGLIGEELDLVIVDEAARIPYEAWTNSIYPCLSSRQGKSVWISTPKGRNHFYEEWMKAKRRPDAADERWKSEDNPHLAEEELKKAKNELPSEVFRQEYEARFLKGAATVFDPDDLDRIKSDAAISDYNDSHLYVMGVDLAKHQDQTVITVIDTHNNKIAHLEALENKHYPYQKKRIKAVAERFGDARIILDSTGVGEPVYDDLLDEGLIVDDFKFTNSSKRKIIDKLRILVEEHNLVIPPNDDLEDQLLSFSYDMTASGNIRYSAPEGMHDDYVDSLALACWALDTNPDERLTAFEKQIKDGQEFKKQRPTQFI